MVVNFDALTYAGNLANLASVEEEITFVRGDICDAATVTAALGDHDIELVVHFAAESHNSLAAIEPGRFFRTNVIGTQTLLEAARSRGVRFHHVSTCEVYGDMSLEDPGAFDEESPYPATLALQRVEGGVGHAGACLRRDLRPVDHHHQQRQRIHCDPSHSQSLFKFVMLSEAKHLLPYAPFLRLHSI